jgi:murein DD-endopeptidase MepM/ murein hydrolase activator NlpD
MSLGAAISACDNIHHVLRASQLNLDSLLNRLMPSRRYTVLVADRTSGVMRRGTVSLRPAVVVAWLVLTTPILIGLGAAWKSRHDVADLYASHQALALENSNYRAATKALAGQVESLQGAVADLGVRSALDPRLARAMNRLPARVKARAMAGASSTEPQDQELSGATTFSLTEPENTFKLLGSVLAGLETRLHVVEYNVELRNALAAATPSMWPAHGWLSSAMGQRRNPFAGGTEYHSGLDIAGEGGQPIFATAAGTITEVGHRPAYGNLIVIDHGFGLETRYGHLLKFAVGPGSNVKRGDIIGSMGTTGRSTGNHLHYEVVANGRRINPIRLLTQRPQNR